VSASASRIERVGADGSSCLALHDGATSLLRPRLTSARASSPPDSGTSPEAREQISQGKTRDGHSIHPPHIRRASPDDMGLRVFVPSRPPVTRLVCGSYSSGRSFACGFLPTSPRGDAVAVRLGVPVIEVPRGLAPPRHFPIRLRVSVDSATHGAARHAWRTQHKEAAEAASFLRNFGLRAEARNPQEMARLRALRFGGQPSPDMRAKVGGRREDRTRDLRIANAALSQLS
jgi:hypothetical protein